MQRARRAAESVTDPELPMLTLSDLGVLRDVDVVADGHVVVDITPTYSGCPAMAAMRDDLVRELRDAGFDRVEVRVCLDPAWTTDWITPEGRAALAATGGVDLCRVDDLGLLVHGEPHDLREREKEMGSALGRARCPVPVRPAGSGRPSGVR